VVEGASLESLYVGNCIVGSNPILSAAFKNAPVRVHFFLRLRPRTCFQGLSHKKKGKARSAAFVKAGQFPSGSPEAIPSSLQRLECTIGAFFLA
jgi:hypothetical protein